MRRRSVKPGDGMGFMPGAGAVESETIRLFLQEVLSMPARCRQV